MATVYLGRVNAAGGFERLVAIKVMHPHIALEADFVTMFLDEARLAARIRHPNVVATHDVDEGPDGLFLVMDYVEGAPLHMVVKAVARARQMLPPDVLLRIFCDVLEGLHAAHELTDEHGRHLGLVHRDVSPHNVLVGADGVSRITDFGVAHARTRLTSTRGTNLKGKVAYLSPEQVLVGRVDRRSDVFSAGVVLWEALTRRRLFKGETEGQTLAQIIGGVRTSPAQVDARIPQSISDVCMKALQGDASTRFQTAIEFADALEAAARSAGITIAKARQVSAYLATLDVPEASLKVPAPPSSASASRSPESVQRIATALAAIAQPREPEPAGHDLPPASSTEPSGTVGGSLVDLTPPPARGRGRGRGLLVALAVLLGFGAAAAVVIVPRLRAVPSQAPAAAAVAPAPPPQPSNTPAPVASTEPAPSPPPSAAAAEAPPKAEPDEAPSGPAHEPARPALTGPVQPRVPKPSATSYKPSEL
jgi:eukaryotic-like serine/threonine-protein kinase